MEDAKKLAPEVVGAPGTPNPTSEATAGQPSLDAPESIPESEPTIIRGGMVASIPEAENRPELVNAVRAQLGRMGSLVEMIKSQSEEERGLRKGTAIGFLVLFFCEIAAIFTAFFLHGLKVLVFEQWVAEAFLSLALVQSATLLGYIVKYLFPDRVNDLVRLIEAELKSSLERIRPNRPSQSEPDDDESP